MASQNVVLNFTNDIPLNEISKKLKICLKKWGEGQFDKKIALNENSENLKARVACGVNFTKAMPFNEFSWKTQNFGGGGQFYKRIPFKRNLQILLKKVKGGQFYKRNPFNRNFRKPQKFAQKFLTEDPILWQIKLQKSRSP